MERHSTEPDAPEAPAEKGKRPSYGVGIVFLLLGLWLVHAGRSASSRGEVIPTEFGAGWIAPSIAYIVALLLFCLAMYLFIAYFRWTRRNQ